MDFQAQMTVDGEALTRQQLQEFLNMAEGLIRYKGKWMDINKEKPQAALEAFERVNRTAAGSP